LREEEQAYVSELHEADGVEGHGGGGDDAEDRDGHLGSRAFHGELNRTTTTNDLLKLSEPVPAALSKYTSRHLAPVFLH